MPVGAADAAREIRRRLPGVGLKKVHKLLWYCQGHHAASTGPPLFAESVSAWDHGPVVPQFWWREKNGEQPILEESLDEGQLNTVGYVVSRYGNLSGQDLENLTHAEAPWKRANAERPAGSSVRIELEWMTTFFESAQDESEDAVPLDRDSVTAWLAETTHRLGDDLRADSIPSLRSRLSDVG